MPSRRRFLATLGAAGSAVSAGCQSVPFVGSEEPVPLGDDFPKRRHVPVTNGWPAFRRDSANTACVPDADPMPEPEVEWQSPTLSIPHRWSWRTVAVDAATVYASDDAAQAFDVISGDRLWRQSAAGQSGTAPEVVDGLAWARSSEDKSTALALDGSSGDVQTRIELPAALSRAPTVTAGRQAVVGPAGGEIASALLDPDSTSDVYPSEFTQNVYGDGALPLAAPEDVIAVSMTSEVYRFSLIGRVGWRTDLDRIARTHPVVGSNRIYVGVESGVVALARDSGQVVWEFDDAENLEQFGIAFDGARVFVGDETVLHAVSAKTGERVWRHEFDEAVTAWPAVGGDRVYVGTGTVVHSLSVDGTHEWSLDVGTDVGSTLAVGESRLYTVADAENEDESRVIALA